MSAPLSRKWNSNLYNILSRFVLFQVKRNARRSKKVPDARTMPDLTALGIGTAKRMNAAIMFFDFENFTAVTSHILQEDTLMILNVATTTVMRIVREWGGTVEKHTGDGVMAILGTETLKTNIIAQQAIESAQTIKYIMQVDVLPQLVAQGLPSLNFRIGIEMGEVLISRIGLHGMNFLTAVGDPANRAAKLEALARPNGIAIGENLARNLHPYLHDFLEMGDDPKWDWHYPDRATPYNYYHYSYEWYEPKLWLREWFRLNRMYR
ncbi:MAG: adenylate/guanylate cyclase domain-containing protein [Euryarchaeota archaeon]|nr:adenylate/guanylate cyclase domain-containing protein [Euryarchaeota archaeon]MBU4492039.1 adenylate/guanylate cyclase domain-containing protein [Euryarchaeota archaeon]